MKEWGWTNPILVSEDGTIIAGHGRVLAARLLGLEEAPVMVAVGWSDAQTRAYVIADNKLALNADWDTELLTAELDELKELGFDLDLVGFELDEMEELHAAAAGEDQDKGSLLALANITIEEPRTAVEAGDHWQLGQHFLLVCSVVADWPVWAPLLKGDALFCPFPGPFLLASEKARTNPLVLVQPDTYTAGHIIDRYRELFGGDDVRKLAGFAVVGESPVATARKAMA
jgi:hypothetical protein